MAGNAAEPIVSLRMVARTGRKIVPTRGVSNRRTAYAARRKYRPS